jgi:hypothetical protein
LEVGTDKDRFRPPVVAELAAEDPRIVEPNYQKSQDILGIIAQLPWTHNVILIQKVKDSANRRWYAKRALLGVLSLNPRIFRHSKPSR